MAAYPKFKILPAIISKVPFAGVPVQLAPTGYPNYGGVIINPRLPVDQGLTEEENLYVSIVPPCGLDESDGHTTKLLPGQQFLVPEGTFVWANAPTGGHEFTAVFFSSSVAQLIPTPVPPGGPPGSKPFPPNAPTGLTKVIPSYLYQEYSDDNDLQAFVASQNDLQQNYVDTFNALNLPIYTGAIIKDALADWVIQGLYGYIRPWIYATRVFLKGPVNTYGPNYLVPINSLIRQRPKGAILADDDFYKRCLTWHYQKGDGRYFNIEWLKRRVMRFLIGVNGSSPHIDQTNQISITFGANFGCTIRFVMVNRTVTGGALCNRFGPNSTLPSRRWGVVPLNSITSIVVTLPPLPHMNEFAEAVATGALELPFQFNFNVVIG